MPGISDPGARLVRAALDAGVAVTVLPGPSAVETALVASGLVGEPVPVPRLPAARREGARGLWSELRAWPWPAVAFESPKRLPATLRSLAAADPERQVAVCRELTKRFEEVVRGTAAELAERFAEPPKGEITLVVGPAAVAAVGAAEDDALAAVSELVDAGRAAEAGGRDRLPPHRRRAQPALPRLALTTSVASFDNGRRRC